MPGITQNGLEKRKACGNKREGIQWPESGAQEDRQVVRWTGISFLSDVTGMLTPVGTFDIQNEIENMHHL